MKLKFATVIAFSGLLFVFSCAPKGTPCDTIWAVEYDNPSFFAEIDSVNKTLSLQIASMSPTLSDYQGEVYQAYFTGDFYTVAQFSNFTVTSPGVAFDGNPYAEMVMYNSETPDTVLDTTVVRAGISRDYIYSSVGFNKSTKTRLSTTTSGTFKINKIGNSLFTQVIAGGDTVSKSISMPFVPVRFAFRLGSFNDSIVSTTTGIKITSFQVSGTTGVTLLGDEFKCNSIYVP